MLSIAAHTCYEFYKWQKNGEMFCNGLQEEEEVEEYDSDIDSDYKRYVIKINMNSLTLVTKKVTKTKTKKKKKMMMMMRDTLQASKSVYLNGINNSEASGGASGDNDKTNSGEGEEWR